MGSAVDILPASRGSLSSEAARRVLRARLLREEKKGLGVRTRGGCAVLVEVLEGGEDRFCDLGRRREIDLGQDDQLPASARS